MAHKVKWILILALVIEAHAFSQAPLLAFPGAEGFGRFAKGGRGGRVIRPTTAALFKAACQDSSGKRIVIAQNGGTFDFNSLGGLITVSKRNLTVPDQCVPGSGNLLKNVTFKIIAPEVILQNVRVAMGDDIIAGVRSDARDCIQMGAGEAYPDSVWNIIIDHGSTVWGIDENVAAGDGGGRLSITNTIIAYALSRSIHPEIEHSKGLLWHMTGGDSVSFIRNLLAHNLDRNARMVGAGRAEFNDNYVYNYQATTAIGGGAASPASLEFRRNYFKPGADTPANKYILTTGGGSMTGQLVYAEGNRGYNRLTDTGDDWLVTALPSVNQSTQPLMGKTGTDWDADTVAGNLLLNQVGPWPRSAIDSAAIASVKEIGAVGRVINGVTARKINFPYGTILHWGRGPTADSVKISITGIGSSSNRYQALNYVVDSGPGAGQARVVDLSSIQNNDIGSGGPGCFLIFNTQFGTPLVAGSSVGHVEQDIVVPVSPVGWPTMTAGTPLTDTDSDGLPDVWEVYFGGTTTSITQSAVFTSDGRTYMDHYMHHCLTLRMAGLPIEPRYLM